MKTILCLPFPAGIAEDQAKSQDSIATLLAGESQPSGTNQRNGDSGDCDGPRRFTPSPLRRDFLPEAKIPTVQLIFCSAAMAFVRLLVNREELINEPTLLLALDRLPLLTRPVLDNQ